MAEIHSGTLLYYFLSAVVLTAPVSLVLVLWYRRAVERIMRTTSVGSPDQTDPELEQQPGDAAPSVARHARARPILLELSDHANLLSPSELTTGDRFGHNVRGRLIRVYVAAGAVLAGVLSYLYFRSSEIQSSLHVFVIWYAFCWPIVPTTAIVTARTIGRAVRDALLYLLVGAALVFAWSSVRYLLDEQDTTPWRSVFLFLALVVWTAWFPALLILVTGNRRVRAAAPAALGALLVFSFSLLAFQQLIIRAADPDPKENVLLQLMGRFGVEPVQWALFLLASLPTGYLVWWAMRRLAMAYRNKGYSDRQLLADTWWLVVTLYTVATTSSRGIDTSVALGLLAFGAYRLTVEAGLRLTLFQPSPGRIDRLLLLRVFGYQKRTEQLFDAVAQRWRFDGTVQLVAGSDLAIRCLDPGGVVLFVGGQLYEQFVRDSRDLRHRLSMLDVTPDPDGRYRINPFYCHDNTWRATLRALLQRSDAVLMDLRSFSRDNLGCVFELEQIIETGPLGRVVFVVDETTDLALLQQTLAAAATRTDIAPSDSTPATYSVHIERQTPKAVENLYQLLRGARPASAVGVNLR